MKPDVYKKLAASGRYPNTGKVLIGLQHIPRQRYRPDYDMERLQAALLGHRVSPFKYGVTIYALYLIGVCTLIAALAEIIK